jgi:hypothetical protein
VLQEVLVVILSKLLNVPLLKARSLIENVFSVIPQRSNYYAPNVTNQPLHRELAPDAKGTLIVKPAQAVTFLPVAITQDESAFGTHIETHVKS